jgi:hypothetical protein
VTPYCNVLFNTAAEQEKDERYIKRRMSRLTREMHTKDARRNCCSRRASQMMPE